MMVELGGWLIFNFFFVFFVGGQLQTLFAEKIDDERRRAAHMLPDHHPHTRANCAKSITACAEGVCARPPPYDLRGCGTGTRYFCCFAPRGAPRQKKLPPARQRDSLTFKLA